MKFTEYGSRQHQARGANIESESIKAFKAWCATNGYDVKEASKHEDMRHHIDYRITRDGKTLSVDVKGMKRGADRGLFLIELLNVRGDLGWLFGKADVIAFQIKPDDFLFVDRRKLYTLMRELMKFTVLPESRTRKVIVDSKLRQDNPEAVCPNFYVRDDRPDEMVTFVQKIQLESATVIV